jgi:hypothetical protein
MHMNYKFVYQQTITVTRRNVIGHQPAQHACTLICCLRPCFLKHPTFLPCPSHCNFKTNEGTTNKVAKARSTLQNSAK